MNEREILKKVATEQGVQVFSNPSQLKNFILQEDSQAKIYANKLELFLETSRLGTFMKDEQTVKSIGKAGYETILYRTVEETGFSYEAVKKLGEDVLFAAGYQKKDVYQLPIPDANKLFRIQKKGIVIEKTEEEARGREAYQCAKIWMRESSKIKIVGDKIELDFNTDDVAVYAFQYLLRAAKDGYEPANGLLGLFYYYGVGVQPDSVMALEYLMRKGGLTEGEFLADRMKVAETLLNEWKIDKKRKISVVAFNILTFVLLIVAGGLSGIVWTVIEAINVILSIYLLFFHDGRIMFRSLTTGVSLVLWIGFILQMCL